MTIYAIFTVVILISISAYYDLKSTIIPNWISRIGIVVAIILQATGHLKEDWLTLLIEFLIFFVPLILLWIIGTLTSFQALAGGDVKIISVMALFVSPFLLLLIVFIAMVLVSLATLRKISFSFYKDTPKEIYYFLFFGIPGKPKDKLQNVPFGPFLLMGTILTIGYFYILI
jgi:Flp pilus assembly protein protease CpaA